MTAKQQAGSMHPGYVPRPAARLVCGAEDSRTDEGTQPGQQINQHSPSYPPQARPAPA